MENVPLPGGADNANMQPGRSVHLKLSEAGPPPIFANYATVSCAGNLGTFYIEFGLLAGSVLRSAAKGGEVQIPVVASIVCPEALIPGLISALQDQYEKSRAK